MPVFVECFFYWFADFFPNWDVSQFSPYIVNLTGRQLKNRYKKRERPVCVFTSLKRRLLSAHGRLARPKPTSYEVFPWRTA
jgi:hypothetical protein